MLKYGLQGDSHLITVIYFYEIMRANVETHTDAVPVGTRRLQNLPVAAPAVPISPSCQQRGACVAHQVALGEPGVTLPRQRIFHLLLLKTEKSCMTSNLLSSPLSALAFSSWSCYWCFLWSLSLPWLRVGGAGRSWVSGETILIITDAT